MESGTWGTSSYDGSRVARAGTGANVRRGTRGREQRPRPVTHVAVTGNALRNVTGVPFVKTSTGSARFLFAACKTKTGDAMAKLVLISLADRAKDDGTCYPSHQTMANDCETSVSTVQRKLKLLEKLGLISKINRSVDGMLTSNLYRLPDVAQGYNVMTTDRSDGLYDRSERPMDRSERPGGTVTVTEETPIETPKNQNTSARGAGLSDVFESWWKTYPRKIGKSYALTAFKKLKAFERDAMLADDLVTRYSGTERQYIPHGDTYVRKKAWMDDLPATGLSGYGEF